MAENFLSSEFSNRDIDDALLEILDAAGVPHDKYVQGRPTNPYSRQRTFKVWQPDGVLRRFEVAEYPPDYISGDMTSGDV